MDLAPPLPHGLSAPPTDEACALMGLCGRHSAYLTRCGAVGRHIFARTLARRAERVVTDAETETAIDGLVQQGFLDAPRPAPTWEETTHGVTTARTRRDSDPLSGEPMYAPTRLGRQIARYAYDRGSPQFAYWRVGLDRLREHVLLALEGRAERAEIAESIYWRSEADVSAAIDELIADGTLEVQEGGLSVPDHKGGELRRAGALMSELRGRDIAEALREAVKQAPEWRLDVGFVPDPALRAILERNISELALARSCAMHTTTVVLAGAIGEGLLFAVLSLPKHRPNAMRCPQAPKEPTGTTKDLDSWMLDGYIQVATALQLVPKTKQTTLSAVLRDFRNLIHPQVQIRKGIEPDLDEAEQSVLLVEQLARAVRPHF